MLAGHPRNVLVLGYAFANYSFCLPTLSWNCDSNVKGQDEARQWKNGKGRQGNK